MLRKKGTRGQGTLAGPSEERGGKVGERQRPGALEAGVCLVLRPPATGWLSGPVVYKGSIHTGLVQAIPGH